jgi:hypothetical protein
MGDVDGTMDPNYIKDPDQPTCSPNSSAYCYFDIYNHGFPVLCTQTGIDANGCCGEYTETTNGDYYPNWTLTVDSIKSVGNACTWELVDVEYYDPAGICSFTNAGTLYGKNDCTNCSCKDVGYSDTLTCTNNFTGHYYKSGQSCGTHPVTNATKYWASDATCYECAYPY